ncbi:MAG: helix-turn-helix domain-containing protein [Treponema sp.]|nr:helix-turn-helix domain-containing protein [Treponema sp.]MCL2252567.1 helix-turn-helix domain-containing protein [Treponema sp.]
MADKDIEEVEVDISAQVKFFAERLREEREKQRISQMDLSFKAGLSQNQVNCIETGKRIPTLHTILRICKALDINPSVLFETRDTERQQAKEKIIRLLSQYW